MTKSLADEIAGLPDPKDVTDTGSVSALSTTPELPDSDTINVPPHLLSRAAIENVAAELVTTDTVGEIATPVVTEEQLLNDLKQNLLNKGAKPELVALMTISDFEIIGKTRKNKMVTEWAHRRKAESLIKEQAHVSPVEQPKTLKVKNPMSKYDDQLKQNSQDINDLKKGMSKIISLLSADQTASVPITTASAPATGDVTIPKVAKQPVAPAVVHGNIAIPKVAAAPMTETGEKLPPADYYRFLITQAKKKNAVGSNGKQYKGVHAVIGGINDAVKEYYGKDTDVVKLTQMLAERGIIAMKMVKRGPMLYLPEDFDTENFTENRVVFGPGN